MFSFRLFRSVRFNLFLFLAIAASAALGTFLPQIGENPEKVEAFLSSSPWLGGIFERLGLFNLYHSWWFGGLLGLMAFDIIVCKLYRRPTDPGLIRLPEEEEEKTLSEAALRAKPYHASFETAEPAEAALPRLAAVLRRRGYAAAESEGAAMLSAGRHRLQGWGSFLAHVSLVLLLGGALVKSVFGFEEILPVVEGQSRYMTAQPWELYVDRFELKRYPGTETPSSFASDIRVYDTSMRGWQGQAPGEPGRLLGKKTIRVNDPLSISVGPLQSVQLYQATWGAGGMFKSVTLRLGSRELVLPQRRRVAIPGTGLSVAADLMLPNFFVGPGNRPDTRDLEPANPAVRLAFFGEDSRTPPLWLLLRSPGLCYAEERGVLRREKAPPFELAAVEPVLFSGVQAAYDPGYPMVLAGAGGMLAGLGLLFYLHRRRVWVLALPGETTRVLVAGWSSRGPYEFKAEFAALAGELEAALAAPAPQGAV